MSDLGSLYETDYTAWAKRHVDLLRARRFSEMDVEHLVQELSDMGKSERRELESRLLILLAHLLKWEYQYHALSERWREFKGDSWRETIVEQRKQLAVLLRQSPGLKPVVAETILATYQDALDLASKETRLPPETFPAHCPYSAEQLLQDDFCPLAAKECPGDN
jgi:transposase